jgi:hypothetical protein
MSYSENYAIETLQKELQIIEKALSSWEVKKFPDERKQREKRKTQLIEAIVLLGGDLNF